jgi:hypothetical protein
MFSALLLLILAAALTAADITGTNPANGACLCISGSSVNIRATACGTVIGSANTGQCFTYRGNKQACTLSGVNYEFFRIAYGTGDGWAAGTFLNVGQASQCSGGGGSGVFTDRCMKCICQVESNCNPNIGCVWDVYSDSCGAYQIKEEYWIDCGRPPPNWRSCANNLACAETCVKAYMARYGTFCTGGRAPTCEDYARIHNGGPRGCTNSNTNGYWDKVRACCGCATCCN